MPLNVADKTLHLWVLSYGQLSIEKIRKVDRARVMGFKQNKIQFRFFIKKKELRNFNQLIKMTKITKMIKMIKMIKITEMTKKNIKHISIGQFDFDNS